MRQLLLFLPLVLLGSSAALAEPGPTKEFAARNFAWTLPSSDWKFVEQPASEQQSGYVVAAVLGDAIRADVRVVPAEGLSLVEISGEVRDQMGHGFKSTKYSTVTKAKLSGLEGSAVNIEGEAQNGTPDWFRAWTTIQDKTIHQLLVHAFNGAQNEQAAAIDSLRRGYRLIRGAGPAEAAAPPAVKMAKPEEAPPAGGNAAGAEPKQEGRVVTFPSQNLRVTLPETTAFKWNSLTRNEALKDQDLGQLTASLAREKPEEGEPRQNGALVTIKVSPLGVGGTAAGIVQNPQNQDNIIKQVFEGAIDAARTKLDLNRKIGNFHGASVMMAASRGKVVHYFIFIVVTLKECVYQFQVKLEGGKEVTQAFGKELAALLNGVEFLDTTEGLRGPLAADPVPPHTGARGEDLDKEVEKAVPGMMLKKPKGLAALKLEGDAALRFAWEGRSADGKGYLFFDARSYDVSEMARSKKTPEDLIRDREGQWKGAGGDKATTVSKGKDPWFETTFGTEKGIGYRFTGESSGVPFVELGWMVKVKGSHFWFRAQFGGEGAEKSMDGLFKTARKGVKFP